MRQEMVGAITQAIMEGMDHHFNRVGSKTVVVCKNKINDGVK